jgi:hypothetical protein
MKNHTLPLVLIIAAILAIFIGRLVLAARFTVPHTFQLFDTLTVAAALYLVGKRYGYLHRSDWLIALVLGLVVGAGMLYATLFSPYPFLGLVRDSTGQALIRGGFTTIATLGGLVVMRQGGPVLFHAALGNWRGAGRGLILGLAIGLPLAVLNVIALQLTQGNPIQWQQPTAALLDALQPGVLEEIIYRFALWGFLWLALRRSLPGQAAWLAGVLAMLVHNFAHYDDLFLQSPLLALGMGTVVMLLWGVPPLILARRRGLESAITFHWIQDVARFLAGY